MSGVTPQSEQLLVAVFSVCASSEVSAACAAACAELAETKFVGEFRDYISPERRPQFAPAVLEAGCVVAIVDCDRDPEQALVAMQWLRTMTLHNLKVVGLGSLVETGYLLKAMRAGCNEFLPKPTGLSAIRETLRLLQKSRSTANASHQASGRVTSLVGAKGGVGATTLAVHLANNLARRHRSKTLLIDHHHELGHVSLLLGMNNGRYHFNDLVKNINRLDPDLLGGFVTTHPSGLDVLSSPDICATHHKNAPDEIKSVLNFLRTQYSHIVIDTSLADSESCSPILRASDEVYLISTPDVAGIRDLARRMEHLNTAHGTIGKLRIVINRAGADDALSAEQLEAAVKLPVWIAIPNNYSDLVRATNAGEPIAADHRSPFAQQISKWAQKMIPASTSQAQENSQSKIRFGFWRKDESSSMSRIKHA
jgi:pilus assembly protein CpaE